MKTSKKLLSVLLSALLLVSCMMTAFAVSGTDGNINWDYDEATKTLTIGGTGVVGPYDYYEAFPGWNAYREEIECLVIEDGVTDIGDLAFFDSGALRSVTIPDSVTSIGYAAFEDCNYLTSVTIPDSVTHIDDKAFRYCESLKSITIPDSVTSIGDEAFAFCKDLRSVTLSNSLP